MPRNLSNLIIGLIVGSITGLVLPAGGVAWGAPNKWKASFSPDTLAVQHEETEEAIEGVIVVAAGPPSTALMQAASALEDAYRKSKLAKLVMSGESLGPVKGLGDPDIVARADHLPVSHIAIVRVFPGAEGEPRTAVVTIYDKSGAVALSFTAKEGEAATAQDRPQATGKPDTKDNKIDEGKGKGVQGTAQKTDGKTWTEVTVPDTRSSKPGLTGKELAEAEKLFRQSEISFKEIRKTDRLPKEWNRSTVIYLGDKKKELKGPEFYRTVGRDDLALGYRKRNNKRWYVMGGGAAIGAIAIGYGLSTRQDCDSLLPAEQGACDDQNFKRLGITMTAAGAAVMIGTLYWHFYNPHPVGAKEARALADRHNNKIRRGLDLPVPLELAPLSEPRPATGPAPRPGTRPAWPPATQPGQPGTRPATPPAPARPATRPRATRERGLPGRPIVIAPFVAESAGGLMVMGSF